MSKTALGVIVGAAYLILCAIVVWLGDFVFASQLQFLSNVIVGLLTIAGGFLLAYWLIERARIKREKADIERTKERKRRIISILKAFKNYYLLPWTFHYACALSGRFELYDKNKIYTGKYKSDIPKLEDVFGIGKFDGKTGKQLRGTDDADIINKEVCERPLSPQSLYSSLNYGLKVLEPIQERIREFPSLIEEVDPEVSKIVHLADFIKSRINLVEEWEKQHEIKKIYTINGSRSNLAIRHNLRTVGHSALDIAIAIEANLEKLTLEIQN